MEWISVKDKLPQLSYVESEDSGYPYDSYNVLLYTSAAHCEGVICVGFLEQEQDEDKWEFGDFSWVCYIPDENIVMVPFETFTHWMPLPKPPEEN